MSCIMLVLFFLFRLRYDQAPESYEGPYKEPTYSSTFPGHYSEGTGYDFTVLGFNL